MKVQLTAFGDWSGPHIFELLVGAGSVAVPVIRYKVLLPLLLVIFFAFVFSLGDPGSFAIATAIVGPLALVFAVR
jgi:hypothetical protein